MVQDIKITPSGAGDKIPQMLFTGSGATAPNMELNVRPDSRLSYESTDGEVFSISPGLQSGVIFAVKDISGLDQISINASGDTYLAPYYGNVRVGATGVIHEDYALDVQGKGLRVGGSGTVLTRASAPAVTTDTLYNVGGSLYFDGSTVGGGSSAGTEAQVQYNDGSSGFAGDAGFTYYKDKAGFTNDRVLVVSGAIIANSGDAHYTNPISIGSGAYVGYGATTPASQASDAIVIGTKSRSGKGTRNVVIGGYAYDEGTHTTGCNTVIGAGANTLAGTYRSIVIGNQAQVSTGHTNISIGNYSRVNLGQNECIVIGNYAGQNGEAAASNYICLGNETSVRASQGIAIGNNALCKSMGGIAIGRETHAGAAHGDGGGIAIGDSAEAGSHAVALGKGAQAPAGGFVLASGAALTDVLLSGVMKTHLTMPNGQQFIQMATAAQTSDLMQWQNSAGVNVASMTPSGVLNVYDIRTSGGAITLGAGATQWAANNTSIVIGKNATAGWDTGIIIGEGASSTASWGDYVTVVGHSATARQKGISIGWSANTNLGGDYAIAIGVGARAGLRGTSIGKYVGWNSSTPVRYGVAIGYNACGTLTSQDFATSIGYDTECTTGATALGSYAEALGDRSIAIGYEAKVPAGTAWVIASGDTAAEVSVSGVFGSYVAIPNDQKLAVGGDVPTYTVDALGHGAVVRATGVIVGNSGIVLSDNVPSVTDFTLYRDGSDLKWNGSAIGGGSAAGAIHQIQYNDGSNFAGDSQFLFSKANSAFTNDRVLVVSGTIIANSGDANYLGPVSIGSGAYVSADDAIAIGTSANVASDLGIAIGSGARVQSNGGVAIGPKATAGNGLVAIGANTGGTYGVVIGNGTYGGYESIAIGNNADAGDSTVNLTGTTADRRAVMIGINQYAVSAWSDTVGIGQKVNYVATNTTASMTTIVGAQGAYIAGYDSTQACLYGARTAAQYGSVAIGYKANAAGPFAVGLGYEVVAPEKHFVVASGSAQTSVMLSGVFGSHLALPNGQQFRQIASAAQTSDLTQWQNSAGVNVAAMTPSGVLNVYDIRTSGTDIAIGNAATTSSTSVAIGSVAVASTANTVALGASATSSATNATALGANTTASSSSSTAVGQGATASAAETTAVGMGALSTGGYSVAIGKSSKAEQNGSVAIGREAKANDSDGERSVAIGHLATADGYGSIAVGQSADANGYGSVAIGYGAVSQAQTWVIASGNTSAAVGISGVFGSYVAIPNDQQLAVGSNVPQYAIDVVRHSGVIRASGVKGCISTNPDAATVTFDLNAATTHAVTLGGNRTLAVSNANVGDKFLIRLQQPASSPGKTVTWFSHIKWAGGTAPTLTSTANKADLLGFLAASGDGGSNIWYDGFVVGQNI